MTNVLNSLPFLECIFYGQKIFVLGILRMPFDCSASPGKATPPSGPD
jgi:hypothetical protein